MNINLTLLIEMVVFAIFVMFTMKFVWTPIMAALDERKIRIADGLAAAERGKREQSLAEQKAAELLRETKLQTAELINRGEKRASEIVDQAKSDAREEAERILTAARAEIETELNKARESLRGQVAELSVLGAEKILEREIDRTTHDKMLNDLLTQL